jgi:hypothetical protein
LKFIAGLLGVLLLAATTVVVAAGATGGAAAQKSPAVTKAVAPTTLHVACARDGGGKLQILPNGTKSCKGRLLHFPKGGPVTACQLDQGNSNIYEAHAKLAPPAHPHSVAGMLFVVAGPGKCKAPKYPHSHARKLPPPKKDLKLCAGKRRGTVRAVSSYSDCNGLEFPAVLKHFAQTVNHKPTADDQSLNADEDGAKPITLTGSDPDGDSLTFTIAKKPSHGSLTGNGAHRVYHPAANFKGTDSFRFKVTDGHGGSDTGKVTIHVIAANDAPVVTTSSDSTAYTENAAGIEIDQALAVSDGDDANLQGATVAITTGFQANRDQLEFDPQFGITGSFSQTTGELELSGTASVSDYRTALRSIRFSSTSDDPPASKTVTFRVADDSEASNAASKTIAVTAVNDAPAVGTSSGALAYTEGDGQKPVDGQVDVGDADSSNLGGAVVKIASGFVQAQDSLAFTPTASITGSYDSTTGVLTLTGSATPLEYQAALRSITYANSSQNPSTAARTVSFEVTDASGADSNTPTKAIGVTAVNTKPTVTTSGGNASSTEGSASAIDTALTVADPDDTHLEGATVRVKPSDFQAGDFLDFAPESSITANYDSSTGVLTLTGHATVSDYQQALRDVKFRTTNDNPSTPKAIEFTGDDGGLDSDAATKSVTVTGVNDAPTVLTSIGTAGYSEGGIPPKVDPSIDVADPDSTNLSGAKVSITGNFTPADGDTLNFTDTASISHAYNSTTGVLTLSGTDTVADYELALQSITFSNTSENPSTATRTVTFQVTDDGALPSNDGTRGVTVATVADAPVLDNSAGSLSYTEGDPAAAIDTAITLSDADSANLSGATVSITTNFQSGDTLQFAPTPNITALYNSGTGVLTLSGTDTVAAYEAALEAVKYVHSGDNPAASKVVTYQVKDAGNTPSNTDTHGISITRVNDAPTLTTTGANLSYTEGDGAKAIDPGIDVADPDSTQIQGATVEISGNFVEADDELSFGDTTTITGQYNDITGVLTLSGTETLAAYEVALQSVKYENVSLNPSGSKTVRFQATDAEGAASNLPTRTIDLTNANTAPTVTTSSGSLSYGEGDSAKVVDGSVAVSDPDSANISSAKVRIASGFQTGDVLQCSGCPAGITPSYDSGTGVLDLTGTDTVANYQTALQSITYSHTGDDPGSSKSVGFQVKDAGNATSNEAVKGIDITGVNDAPTLTATALDLEYTEGDGPVAADPGIDVADPDSAQIQGATVKVSAGFVQADDELSFASTANISGGYDDTTGVLTLSGTDTVAAYEAALRSVKYENVSQNPSGSKTLSFQATDSSGAASNVATRDVNLTNANDAPVVTTTSGPTSYTEGQSTPPQVDSGVTVADADDTTLTEAHVRISSGFQPGDDLQFSDTATIDGTYHDTTGVLDLVGTDTVANYEAALQSIKYATTNANPSSPKVVEFKVKDAALDSNAATKNIVVTGVNTAPSVSTTAAALSYSEGDGAKVADSGVAASDPDSANLSGAKVTISGNFVAADDELSSAGNANITPSYNDTTGVLTLSGTDTVAAYNAVLQAVTYENVSQNPSGSKTLSFEVTDDGALTSTAATRTVDLTAVNDAPVITPTIGSTPYTEGDLATTVDSGVTVSDADDTNVAGGRVRISSGFQTGDVLQCSGCPAGITPSYNATNGELTLSGTDTVGNYQTALQSVKFVTTNPAPVTSKTVEFRVTDPHTTDSNTPTKEISITPVNSPPTVDAASAALSYTENDAATFVDPTLTVTEPEGDSLTGGSASITGNYQAGQDALSWADNNGSDLILLGVASDAQTINLTGPGTDAEYQAALRNVKYVNTSESPSNVTRTVTFSATDTLAATGSDTRSISVTSVDDPPVASNDAATVLEDATDTPVDILTNDNDVDNGTKTISSKTNPTNGTVAITGGGTGLTYKPNANYCNSPTGSPSATPDTFTYTLNGSANPAQTATVSMTVTCVNDSPVVTGESLNGASSMVGNTKFIGNDPSDGAPSASDPHKTVSADILSNDTDVDGPGPLIVQDTDGTNDSVDHRASNLGGSVSIESDGDFVYSAPTTANGANPTATNCDDATDSFQYTVSDQNPGTAGTSDGTVTLTRSNCVWYVNNNDASGDGGTSDKPFDTLAQADTATPAGDAIFVFKGTGTTTGYDAGVDLAQNQKLIGEAADLTIGSDTLKTGDASRRPILTDTANDVVVLDDANEVRGLDIDPAGVGNGGIAGGTGDASGTIDDVHITDTATLGTGPGLELDSTSGTWNISNLTVDQGDNLAATTTDSGIRLNNAGTVNFLPSGTVSVTTAGARALDLTATNMGAGSVFDDVASSVSGAGGVNMNGTTGTTTIGDGTGTDLDLTTTAGATAALTLANPGTVSVPGGTGSVSATGGPAVNVTNAPNVSLPLGTVQSQNSSTDGINWDGNGASTFTAQSGGANGIKGANGIAVDVNGGNGTFTYPGALDDGTGATAEVTGRTGGAVTLSGPITDGVDSGGGITVGGAGALGNSGGSTTFSNATKTLSTGSGDAIVMTNSDGHTLNLTNGGLNIDTAGGRGLEASGSGTINVTTSTPASTSPNSIGTGSGRALNLTQTDIGSSGVTFHDISSSGATSGILLDHTGTTAGLVVSGSGSTAQGGDASGGTINNDQGDAVSMNTTTSPSFNNMTITSAQHAGVEGRNVHGFTYTNGTVSGAGAAATDPNHDSSITFDDATGGTTNNVDGVMTVTNDVLSNAFAGGVDVEQYNGTLSDAQIKDNAISSSSLPASSKGNGIQFLLSGSGGTVANLTKATIQNNNVTNFPSGNGITVLGGNPASSGAPSATMGTPTGTPGSSGNAVVITANRVTGNASNLLNGDAILASLSGRGQGRFSITNNGTLANPITNIKGLGVNIGAAGAQTADFEVTGNRIVANSQLGSNGIGLGFNKWTQADLSVQSNVTAAANISSNNVSQSSGQGIRVILSDATVNAKVKVTSNTVGPPTQGNAGIRVDSGSSAGTGDTLCTQIDSNNTTGSTDLDGDTHPGIELGQRASAVFGIVGLSPSPATAAQAETYLTGQNPSSAPGAGDPFYAGKRVVVRVGSNFTSCNPLGF